MTLSSETVSHDEDYSGIPMGHLRKVILESIGMRSKRYLARTTGITAIELSRILRKAPDTAVIGLAKADRIFLALNLNVSQLERMGQVNVVPLGSSIRNARLMIEDTLAIKGRSQSEHTLDRMARLLMDQKKEIINELKANPIGPILEDNDD